MPSNERTCLLVRVKDSFCWISCLSHVPCFCPSELYRTGKEYDTVESSFLSQMLKRINSAKQLPVFKPALSYVVNEVSTKRILAVCWVVRDSIVIPTQIHYFLKFVVPSLFIIVDIIGQFHQNH